MDYTVWGRIEYQPEIDEHRPISLVESLPLKTTFLEIGCGSGRVSVWLAEQGFSVAGVDINQRAICAARDRAEARGVSARCRFDQLDAVKAPLASADVVFAIRVLTCLNRREHRRELAQRMLAAAAPDGRVFVHDFLFDPANSKYASRYDDGLARGLGPGNFRVPGPDGDTAFIAHHHTEREAVELFHPGQVEDWYEHRSLSMRGNPIRMFRAIYRQPSTPGELEFHMR